MLRDRNGELKKMSDLRSTATARSTTFISVLLVSTAFSAPAFAQIETVVVTAEKKSEDIQTVPVAVTALSGADLKAKQITTFKDLQFNVPNLTFSKDGLGGGRFTIRGIGPASLAPVSLFMATASIRKIPTRRPELTLTFSRSR